MSDEYSLESLVLETVTKHLHIKNPLPGVYNQGRILDLNHHERFVYEKVYAFCDEIMNITESRSNNIELFHSLKNYFTGFLNDKQTVGLMQQYDILYRVLTMVNMEENGEREINDKKMLVMQSTGTFFQYLNPSNIALSRDGDLMHYYILLDDFCHLELDSYKKRVPPDLDKHIHAKIGKIYHNDVRGALNLVSNERTIDDFLDELMSTENKIFNTVHNILVYNLEFGKYEAYVNNKISIFSEDLLQYFEYEQQNLEESEEAYDSLTDCLSSLIDERGLREEFQDLMKMSKELMLNLTKLNQESRMALAISSYFNTLEHKFRHYMDNNSIKNDKLREAMRISCGYMTVLEFCEPKWFEQTTKKDTKFEKHIIRKVDNLTNGAWKRKSKALKQA